MKKLKKLLVLLTAALFVMLPVLSQPLTAQAETTATTYYVKYDTAKDEWRYQVGSAWDSSSADRAFYYLTLDIKDGDLVVVEGEGKINLNVNLSNLTIVNSDYAVVSAKSITDVYVLNDSTAAITGDVINAYVYGKSTVNFNSNVANLELPGTSDDDRPDATVNVLGTVGRVKAYDNTGTYYDYYDFAAGSLVITNGSVKTDASKYSTTPSATTTAPTATTTTTTTTPTTSSSSDELDEVPKTGDFSVSPVWFLAIAVVCMLGYCKLERR